VNFIAIPSTVTET